MQNKETIGLCEGYKLLTSAEIHNLFVRYSDGNNHSKIKTYAMLRHTTFTNLVNLILLEYVINYRRELEGQIKRQKEEKHENDSDRY